MFIQVITAPCTAHDELRSVLDSWETDLAPTAEGWLGGTYGFTDDDEFVAVVRFDSREHAMANSERPEQGAWAERFAATLAGTPEFRDYDDVLEFLDGGSDDAGFVQVIEGRAEDPDLLRQLLGTTDLLRQARPEIIGGTVAMSGDGSFTETIAFTDEASARVGEKEEPPPEVRDLLAKVMVGARFRDLHNPWFASP
jgi:hypothetical protein